MEKLNLDLFREMELSQEAQIYLRGGDNSYQTSYQTNNCDSTWLFWEDCETTTDQKWDQYNVLPAQKQYYKKLI